MAAEDRYGALRNLEMGGEKFDQGLIGFAAFGRSGNFYFQCTVGEPAGDFGFGAARDYLDAQGHAQ